LLKYEALDQLTPLPLAWRKGENAFLATLCTHCLQQRKSPIIKPLL